MINKYGADALRLYLINSPVVRAETLRFKEEGVFGVVKDVFMPWYNAYRFLVQNVKRLEVESGTKFSPAEVSKSFCGCGYRAALKVVTVASRTHVYAQISLCPE